MPAIPTRGAPCARKRRFASGGVPAVLSLAEWRPACAPQRPGSAPPQTRVDSGRRWPASRAGWSESQCGRCQLLLQLIDGTGPTRCVRKCRFASPGGSCLPFARRVWGSNVPRGAPVGATRTSPASQVRPRLDAHRACSAPHVWRREHQRRPRLLYAIARSCNSYEPCRAARVQQSPKGLRLRVQQRRPAKSKSRGRAAS